MEGRRVFEHLTVEENLIVGAHTRKDRHNIKADLQKCIITFRSFICYAIAKQDIYRVENSKC